MRIDIMTLFPALCEAYVSESIIGRAVQNGKIEIYCHNIRDYTKDKHNRVDDAPYGGGNGMILSAQPIDDCFKAVCEMVGERPYFIYMSPQGKTLTQPLAVSLKQHENIAILCGHYEGVDQRVLDKWCDMEISIGDYVLTGGELPALVLTDVLSRMVDGVLPNEDCYKDESHYDGLLEYPQFTRPAVWDGREVPEILLSGHHLNIEKWKQQQRLSITKQKRPDLFYAKQKDSENIDFIDNIGK